MKKLTIISLIMASVLFLSACSKQESEQKPEQLPEQTPLVSAQEEQQKPEIKAPVIKGIETPTKEEEQDAKPSVQVLPPTTPVTPAPKKENCTSLECLAELAKTCGEGQVVYHYSVPAPFISALTMSGSTQFVLKGKDASGQCMLSVKANEAVISISEEKRAEWKVVGITDVDGVHHEVTDEMIDTQIKTMNDSLVGAYNSITTCTGTGANIATYLLNAKAGNAQSSCTINFGEGATVCTFEPGLTCIQ